MDKKFDTLSASSNSTDGSFRLMGRQLARELSAEEISQISVGGGSGSRTQSPRSVVETSGWDDLDA